MGFYAHTDFYTAMDLYSQIEQLLQETTPEDIIDFMEEQEGSPSANADPEADLLPTAKGQIPSVERRPLEMPVYRSGYAALQNLRAVHYKIISLHIGGMSNTDIARKLNLTNQTVGKCLASDLAQGIIQQWAEDSIETATTLKEQLVELGTLAVYTLEDILLHNPDDRARLAASRTVLEYAESKAAQRTEHVGVTVTADMVQEMRARSEEVKPPNMISDADYEEVEE
jgi:hypothetical protein